MAALRTPAQALVLRMYRSERRLGQEPLDAIDSVRAQIALTGMAVARRNDGRVYPEVLEEMRAADAMKVQIRLREHAALGIPTIGAAS